MSYNSVVNQKDFKKIEKIAKDSEKHARLAIKKSNQVQTLLSYMEYKAGKVRRFSSVEELFKRLKI